MFEAAEIGRAVGKEGFQREEPELRVELLRLQYELRDADFPVIVVVSGNDRAGCHDVINLLHEWMDARYLEAHVYGFDREEERMRPWFWRFWHRLPRQGRLGLFVEGWTHRTLLERLRGQIGDAGLERRLGQIVRFERALTDGGALLLKFWLHLPKKGLKARLKAAKKSPDRFWWVREQDRKAHREYYGGTETTEHVLRRTSTGRCPWHVVESTDSRYRNLTVAKTLAAALARRLEGAVMTRPPEPEAPGVPIVEHEGQPTLLDTLDLTPSLTKASYYEHLAHWQRTLNRLNREALEKGVTSVLVFEGPDAAGKGGVIRRMIRAMDAASYRVIPIAAPTPEELAHHYLWRFWTRLPREGHTAFFDRSWYGRVLVERVEGFARETEWRRSYREINDFEEQLVEYGIVLAKFWLQIDPEEQLRRFEAREKVPFKKYKMTPEDYRNRKRWDDYQTAAVEMVERTSTPYARWNLVAANNKRWARIQVLEEYCRRLEEAVE